MKEVGQALLHEGLMQIESLQAGIAKREARFGVVSAEKLKTSDDRDRQYAALEAMMEPTPLRILPMGKSTILVKQEALNPTGSHYDRATIAVLKRLEKEGFLKPGDTILEGTSGSAGRSFAYYCNRLGFNLDMIVPHPDEIPEERLRDMRDLGANVIHAAEKGGMKQVIRDFRKRLIGLKKDGWVRHDFNLEGKPVLIYEKEGKRIVAPNHSEISITPDAFANIAREAVSQLPKGMQIDTFIGTLGNGATMKGITDALSEIYGRENLTIIGTEYKSSPTNAIRALRARYGILGEDFVRLAFYQKYGYTMPKANEMTYHDSFGSSTPGYEPPFVDVHNIDEIIVLGDEWREFKRRQNINATMQGNKANLLGNTSAENQFVAIQLAELRHERTMLVIQYDDATLYPDFPPVLIPHTYPQGDRADTGRAISYAIPRRRV